MLNKILSNKNVHYVKFMRGSTAAWEALKRTPSKISNDTLYFINNNLEKPHEGKLYLGKKLISGEFNIGDLCDIEDLENVNINLETLTNGDILQFDSTTESWINSKIITDQAITNIAPITFPTFAHDGEVLILTEGQQPEIQKQEVILNITSISMSPNSEEESPSDTITIN